MSPWMTPEEAAEYLRLLDDETKQPDARKARKLLKNERVQPFKLGRLVRYRREDVEGVMRAVAVVKLPRRRSA